MSTSSASPGLAHHRDAPHLHLFQRLLRRQRCVDSLAKHSKTIYSCTCQKPRTCHERCKTGRWEVRGFCEMPLLVPMLLLPYVQLLPHNGVADCDPLSPSPSVSAVLTPAAPLLFAARRDMNVAGCLSANIALDGPPGATPPNYRAAGLLGSRGGSRTTAAVNNINSSETHYDLPHR